MNTLSKKAMNRLLLLTLFLPCWLPVSAQSTPGGVPGAEAWFQTLISNDKTTWFDRSGDNVLLTASNGNMLVIPTAPKSFFNFQPALALPSNISLLLKLKTVLSHSRLGLSTIMGVYAPLTIKNQPAEYVPYVYTDFQAAIPNHSVWGENQGTLSPVNVSTDENK